MFGLESGMKTLRLKRHFVVLESLDVELMFAEKFDAFGGCLRARNRSVIRHLVIQRAAPDKVGIGVGMGIGRSVDDHGDCAFFDGVGDMRAALLNLVNHFRRNPPRLEICCGNTSAIRPRSLSFLPTMIRAAILASGTPMALLTKGTVREARGLTSST